MMLSLNPAQTRAPFLPPDLWAHIALYIPFISLRRLKMTGSKQLWQRLAAKGVVKSVTFGKDSHFLHRSPMFLNELPSIEELVYNNKSETWNQDWKPGLRDVPKTLTRLTILDPSKDFFANDFRLIEHVPMLYYLDVNLSWTKKNDAWTKHIPSNLIFLSVSKWDGTALPTTLLKFKTKKFCPRRELRAGLAVPSQLESLTVSMVVSGAERVLTRILPASIRTLAIKGWEYSDLDANFQFRQLASLTSLGRICFQEDIYDDPHLLSDPASLLPLPICLTELRVKRFPATCWQYLPPSLRRLYLDNILYNEPSIDDTIIKTSSDGVAHCVKRFPIHALPKALLSLTLRFDMLVFLDTDDTIGATMLFPPLLTELIISAQISVSVADQLPSTLTCLEVKNLDYTVCKHLPRGLTQLVSGNVIMSPKLVKYLPTSLINLTLHVNDSSYGDCHESKIFDPETGQAASLKELHSKYSQTLNFGRLNHNPPINCSSSSTKASSNDLNGTLSSSSSAEQESLMQLWQGDACLPPGLERLELHMSELTDSFFVQTLPSLKWLSLRHSKLLTDDIVPRLPRGLERLDLCSSEKITGKSPFLPKSLYLPSRQ